MRLGRERDLAGGCVRDLLLGRAPRGDLVGLVMILADPKSLKGEAPMQSVAAPLRATLQKIAVLLRVKAGNTGATSAVFEPMNAPAPISVKCLSKPS